MHDLQTIIAINRRNPHVTAQQALNNGIIDSGDLTSAIEDDEDVGFCIVCGTEHTGIEPDARNYVCEECGEAEVFGAEEILMMTTA